MISYHSNMPVFRLRVPSHGGWNPHYSPWKELGEDSGRST